MNTEIKYTSNVGAKIDKKKKGIINNWNNQEFKTGLKF